MYGDRIEKLISLIERINTLGRSTDKEMPSYRLLTPGDIEAPKEMDKTGEINQMKSLQISLQIEIDQKIKPIERANYVGATQMHNSIGSPFVEIYRLNDALKEAISYGANTNPFPWIGQKVTYQIYVSYVVQYAIDAKYAVMNPLTSDYLERGYRYLEGDRRAVIYEDK